MPPEFKRRTPIQDRIYRSSPAIVQSKLPKLQKVTRMVSSTPSSTNHQSTLTQMDFATPRQFAVDAEIANSDDEGDFLDERPYKRIKTGETISSTTTLLKQSTLTQIDFVKLMREGIPDSDEDSDEDIDPESGMTTLNVPEPSTHSYAEVQVERSEDTFHNNPTPRNEQGDEIVEEDFYLNIITSSQTEDVVVASNLAGSRSVTLLNRNDVPETPRRPRNQPVPSSQTPVATPISIPGTQRQQANHEPPASPTPVRMAPPALPFVRHSSPKERPINLESQNQTHTQQLHTQTQTQTTPMTKMRIADFNRRFAELTGNLDDIPGLRQDKSKSKHVMEQDSFDVGEDTQAMLLQIEIEEPEKVLGQELEFGLSKDSQTPGQSELHQKSLKDDAQNPRSLPPGKKVVIIQSSQDDEYVSESSQASEEVAIEHNEGIVPASSPRVDIQNNYNRLNEPTSHVILNSQFNIQSSQPSIRPSQASTAPCTPKIEGNAFGRVPDSHASNRVENASPALPLFDDHDMEGHGITATPKRVTISQLLPSSLIGSDLPRPPQDSIPLYDEEDEEDDEL